MFSVPNRTVVDGRQRPTKAKAIKQRLHGALCGDDACTTTLAVPDLHRKAVRINWRLSDASAMASGPQRDRPD
jgi:hypothetical protein